MPATKTKSHHILSVIKAGISAIPYVGGPIAGLIGDYVPSATQRSVETAFEMLKRRKWVDKRVSEALQDADEITIIGYSMPPYDFDFKSLLMKGLMGNKKRTHVPINVIDKGKGEQLHQLELRFKHIAGEVRVIGQNGFLDFIKTQT